MSDASHPVVFAAGLGALLLAGVAGVGLRRRGALATVVFATLTVTGGALAGVSALRVLAGAAAWEVRVAAGVPGGAWVFGLDALSAFFVLAIAIVGTATAIYGCGYQAEVRRPAVWPAHGATVVLVAALLLVVVARSAVPFLIAWEGMAVTAFVLVMFDHHDPAVRRAGLVYLVTTHTATLALLALFALWGAGTADLSFTSLAGAAPGLTPVSRAVLLLLALGAFGVKAGVVPLHFWLPLAHAAAPSHISGLMSGLVIKTGIYGLLRVVALMGGAPEWFGWTLLGCGVVSGVLGVVWALAQHDLKKLLAYHSVENIGIILIGMGAGVLGTAYRLPAVAALGFAGAILHVLNHALFKGLLFLGAGSVARAAGSRQLDALGGLARAMPATWLAFLLASAAIVGLPPLNGFVSEWTIVRSLLGAGLAAGPVRVALFAVGALGLIGGLALACFAKVNGAVFLGHARSAGAVAARETGRLMLVPMGVLAAGCVIIGVAPAVALAPALAAAGVVTGRLAPADAVDAAGAVSGAAGAALLVALALGTAWGARALLMRGRWSVVPRTWSCGYPDTSPRMQYTASSFAAPVLEPFGAASGIRAERTGDGYVVHAGDPAFDDVLLPAWRRVHAAVQRRVRTGRLHVSLLYVLATVIVLLLWLAAGSP